MGETLWEKVNQFLYQLHYEDTDREPRYESEILRKIHSEKEEKRSDYMKVLEGLSKRERKSVEEFLEVTEQCVYEECQQAYVQGIIDCLIILGGAGIIKPRHAVEELLDKMK